MSGWRAARRADIGIMSACNNRGQRLSNAALFLNRAWRKLMCKYRIGIKAK